MIEATRPHLQEACSVFPRLAYLSDVDLLRVAAHGGSPVSLIPLIKKIFPSLGSLRFMDMTSGTNPVDSSGKNDVLY